MIAPDVGAPRGSGEARVEQGQVTPTILHEPDAERKRFAKMAAHAALAGFQLHALDNGFMISRWAWCKSLPDLDAAEAWLRGAGLQV